MARSANQKAKILVLRQILLSRTDEDHPMSMAQLIAALEERGIQAERKSVYSDLEALSWMGLDVQCRRGRQGGWFIGERPFQLAELKLLVDAVQSCRFITAKKSGQLIGKLEALVSAHQARQLQRQVYVSGRVKAPNEHVYYNIDKLHTAIHNDHMVTFRYFIQNPRKERVFRRDGGRYRVSPLALLWDNENYYLAGLDEDLDQVRHYRVDKMADIALTGAPRRIPEGFDPAGYGRRHFGMFTGRPAQVTLVCRDELAGVVLDRFGQDAMLVPREDGHFSVSVDVVVSPQFWGWIFALGEGVRVAAPQWAVAEYRRCLQQALEACGKEENL